MLADEAGPSEVHVQGHRLLLPQPRQLDERPHGRRAGLGEPQRLEWLTPLRVRFQTQGAVVVVEVEERLSPAKCNITPVGLRGAMLMRRVGADRDEPREVELVRVPINTCRLPPHHAAHAHVNDAVPTADVRADVGHGMCKVFARNFDGWRPLEDFCELREYGYDPDRRDGLSLDRHEVLAVLVV